MKQIKKIVLRDATKLTNSEMKSIRGGIIGGPIGGYSSVCSASCYHSTGAYVGDVQNIIPCAGNHLNYCDIISGADGILGVACYTTNSNGSKEMLKDTQVYCSQQYSE